MSSANFHTDSYILATVHQAIKPLHYTWVTCEDGWLNKSFPQATDTPEYTFFYYKFWEYF